MVWSGQSLSFIQIHLFEILVSDFAFLILLQFPFLKWKLTSYPNLHFWTGKLSVNLISSLLAQQRIVCRLISRLEEIEEDPVEVDYSQIRKIRNAIQVISTLNDGFQDS